MRKSFLPKQYKVPVKEGAYTKLQSGETTLRILDEPELGYSEWVKTEDGKKVYRHRFYDEKGEMLPEPDGAEVKHFWALPVFNYSTKKIEIWEVTQVGIQQAIENLLDNDKWGSPIDGKGVGYDITITKSGEKLSTKYSVVPAPHEEVHAKIKELWGDTNLDMSKLFDNESPFLSSTTKSDDDGDLDSGDEIPESGKSKDPFAE